MTIEERQQAAMEVIKSIETQFGLRLIPVLTSEQYNSGVATIKATLALEPIPGWAEPAPNGTVKSQEALS